MLLYEEVILFVCYLCFDTKLNKVFNFDPGQDKTM